MRTLVLLLEERSAQALLEGLLPRILPAEIAVQYLVFEGKQDLEKNVARKLRGWQRPDTSFVVLRDQDAGDCAKVKQRLVDAVRASGKTALVRVACRDLEAWVAGDLDAVASAFDEPTVAREKNKARFRDPDGLVRPVEELRRLVLGYQKIDGARRVGPLLDPERNSSRSFRTFCSGVRSLCSIPTS
jgi:hypothetical protein